MYVETGRGGREGRVGGEGRQGDKALASLLPYGFIRKSMLAGGKAQPPSAI
jgi:hypothetical protein